MPDSPKTPYGHLLPEIVKDGKLFVNFINIFLKKSKKRTEYGGNGGAGATDGLQKHFSML